MIILPNTHNHGETVMKIDKNYAFEILKKLELHFPKSINLKVPNGMFGNNPRLTDEDRNKIDAHIEYLVDEELIRISSGSYKLTSKAINLLTDGTDMETWIKKHQ